MKNRFTIVTLYELLALAVRSEQGFIACSSGAHNELLKTMFRNRANRCANVAGELRSLLLRLTTESDLDHGASVHHSDGAARRGWMDLRSALALNDDDALISQCEHGGDCALEVYRNALDDHLPEWVREVVLRQFEELMDHHDQIRGFRNEPPPTGVGLASTGGNARQ